MIALDILFTLALAGPSHASPSSGPRAAFCERLMLDQTDIADLPESVRGLHSTYRLLSLDVKRHVVTSVVGAADGDHRVLFDRLGDILIRRELPFVQVRISHVRTNVVTLKRDATGFHLKHLMSDRVGPSARDLAARLPRGTALMIEAPASEGDLADYALELVALFELLDGVRRHGDNLMVAWAVPSRGLNAIADAGHHQTIFDHSDPLYLESFEDAAEWSHLN